MVLNINVAYNTKCTSVKVIAYPYNLKVGVLQECFSGVLKHHELLLLILIIFKYDDSKLIIDHFYYYSFNK